jgi:hypothetical protein
MSNIISLSNSLSLIAAKFAEGKDISVYAEQNEDDAHELHRAIGGEFSLIGVGGYRAVFIHKDFPGLVFKVDMYGTSQGLGEWDIYSNSDHIEQLYLAPVLHATYHVCVMRRIDGVPLSNAGLTEEEESAYFFVHELNPKKYYDSHVDNYILCSNSGRMILVDYA